MTWHWNATNRQSAHRIAFDGNKGIMKKRNIFLVICIVLLLAGVVPSPLGVQKIQAKSLREQIRDKQKEKDLLKNQLDEQKGEVKGLKNEKTSLQDEMADLNDSMLEACARYVDLQGQIEDKTQEIEDNQAALADAIVREQQQQEDMEIRARKMYERNSADYVTSLLQAGSFGELLNLATWFERVETYDKERLQDYQDAHANIVRIEEELEAQKAELDGLFEQAEEEKDRMSALIAEISSKIDEYSAEISSAEKQALLYEAQLKQSEADLKVLQKKLEEELRISREAAEGKWRTIDEVVFDEGDRKLLANIIYCEAGGEPYEGKVAVGAVVINRVLSNRFPDTVYGVIYQKNQFSPVASGRYALALEKDKATAACYQAADEAMQGVTNVGVCVFFRTPIKGLTGISIGHHIFY
jgi:spore germination cell wall hydrolase CwlJ-like protein/cell division protein FtsB